MVQARNGVVKSRDNSGNIVSFLGGNVSRTIAARRSRRLDIEAVVYRYGRLQDCIRRGRLETRMRVRFGSGIQT